MPETPKPSVVKEEEKVAVKTLPWEREPDMWSEERSAPDREAGELVYYREHLKRKTKVEVRRETLW